MRITTWNVNGIRAAIRKGFSRHISEIQPDVLLLQEIRCTPEQLPEEIRNPDGWYVTWNPATKKGYSGTAIWSRFPFEDVSVGIDCDPADTEGRVIRCVVKGIHLASVYLPSGSSGPLRQEVKDRWLGDFQTWVTRHQHSAPFILGGDLNIAHTESDIFYAKSNENTSGFLPHERLWFGQLLNSGWHDLVREHFGAMQGPYTWWSNRGKARELDRGWRIDYLLSNVTARPYLKSAQIHRQGGLEVSDHAPVSIDLDVS